MRIVEDGAETPPFRPEIEGVAARPRSGGRGLLARLGQRWAPVTLAGAAVAGGLALVTLNDSFVPTEPSIAGGPAATATGSKPGALAIAIDQMAGAGTSRRGASGLAGADTEPESSEDREIGQAAAVTTAAPGSASERPAGAAVPEAATTTDAPTSPTTEADVPTTNAPTTSATGRPTSEPDPSTTDRPTTSEEPTTRPSTAPSSTEVAVVEDNQAPSVDSPGVRRGRRGTPEMFDVSAFDPDGDPLSFRADGLPPGTQIGLLDGLIEGTPTSAGTFTVTVTAVDDQGASGQTTFGWLVAGPSQGPNCGLEGAVSSVNSARLINFRLTNETSGALDVYWLDYEGRRVPYGSVGPGETVDRPTYETQPWVLADPETGDCVHLVSDPRDGDGVVVR